MKAKSTLIPILVALLVAVAPLASLSATSLSVAPSASSAAPLAAGGVNLIVNGDFSAGMTAWWSYGVTTDASSGDLQVTMPGGLVNPYDAGVGQDNIAVLNGTEYRLKFDASADTNVSIHVVVQNPDTFHNYIDQVVNLTSTPTTFTYTFVADEDKPTAKFIFQVGGPTAFIGQIDNVSLMPLEELIVNGDFSDGMTAWWSYGVTADASSGYLQVTMPGGLVNPYDAGVGQDNIAVLNGDEYTLSFDASADTNVSIHVVVQNPDTFHNYIDQVVNLTSTPTTFTYTFVADEDKPTAKFIFQVGGPTAFIGQIDNVSLKGPAGPPPPPPALPSHIGELLFNGAFSNGLTAPWWSTPSVSLAVAQGRLEATITNGGANPWDAIVGQSGIPVFVDGVYTLTMKVWASQNATVNAILQEDGGDFTQYFSAPLALTPTPKTFTFTFTSTAEDPAAVLQFQMGGQGNFVVFFDNLSLNGPEPVSHMQTGAELIINGDFSQGFAPWWNTANVTPDTSSGALQATINSLPGPNTYDAIVGQNNIPLLAGGNYVLEFDAWASTPVTILTLLQLNGPPFTGYFSSPVALTTTPQHFSFTFTSTVTDPAAGFQFPIGANGLFTFNVDNVSLLGPKPTPPTEFLTAVRLNQTGYLKSAPKKATIAVDVTSPLPWKLYNSANTVVKTGTTTIFGLDSASGERVHTVDFSSFKTAGAGYTLEVYGERSQPFDIGDNVYRQLKYDALAYFYHNRSGIAITMPFAGDPQWTRPAGHINVAPNQGDFNVPCFDQVDLEGHDYIGCNYTLNVVKGWYDAGDHGKYVVNGGISVWTLLDEYERAKYIDDADKAVLFDGVLNIPENDNHVADILDEARWELEFMLSMQVPMTGTVEGQALGGMVHHKVHDLNWTALGLAPDQDPQPRYLYPPSTAATLNLAANAAQCARIWKQIDTAFSNRCRTAAESAWTAAVAHPDIYARVNFTGGGAYEDTDVSDEFYWAASELYITTGKSQYRNYITQSPHFLKIPSEPSSFGVIPGSSMTWQKTQALGTISLALVPNNLSSWDKSRAKSNISRVADGYAKAITREGYLLPYRAVDGIYLWGSNSDVLNNMIILGLAYDFTGKGTYRDAVSQGMDYLLGRNPNVKSYVAGYGERPLQNPHHRFWARQLNPAFPPPAPGALSGGPNSNLQDPFIQTLFQPGECPAQKCYADHIESFSTNEVAINWNSPLAWAVAFLDGAYDSGFGH